MTAVRLLLPAGRLQGWHQTLVDKLIGDGRGVSVELCETKVAPGAALALVEQLEALLYQRESTGATAAIAEIAHASGKDAAADLVFDLTGDPLARPGAIAPLYDGAFGDAARDFALMQGRAPEIVLAASDSRQGRALARGRPAIERPRVLASGRAAVAGCLVTLLRTAAMLGGAAGGADAPAPATGTAKPIAFLAAGLAEAARRRLAKMVAREGHWRVGWRALAGAPDVFDALDWPAGEPWTWLPDDGARYYADPFLFREGGSLYVFVEEFPYATARGIISVFTIDAQGRASVPVPVLERPYHLSYPLVFRHEGRIWMMPESSANGTLELYVADAFPTGWRLHSTVLSDISISDATMFPHDGGWWLTAAAAERGASTWDCLALFRGASPVGPWTRSSDLPVLVDASAARPAGHVFSRNGALWRPAQDCTRGYGSGLALCRVDALDEAGFRQTVVARLGPPAGAPDQGVHTLNSDGGIEIIDAVGAARANWRSERVA